jgi:hypothetical protein
MASIDITTQSGAVGNGDLQLQNGAPMDATLRFVTDALNTASPLKLSTSLVQTTSTLKITTNDNPYIDAEDGSGNNRFTVGRATSSQQVNVDFASNPAGSTTAVGAIRTFRDGTNLSEAMTFIEDGSVGIGTTAPVGILDLFKSAAATRLAIRGDAGQNRLISYRTGALQRFGLYVNNTAESGSNAGSDFAIRAYNDAGTLLSTPLFIQRSTGNIGIGTTTPTQLLDVNGTAIVRDQFTIRGGVTGFNPFYAASYFIDNNGGTTYFNLTGGNVGIGTSSPEINLDVKSIATAGSMGLFIENAAASTLNNSADIYFGTWGGSSVAGITNARISAVNVNAGNAESNLDFYTYNGASSGKRISVTSNGLTFNGDTAAANALDDYEEGTWTMGVSFGGGTTGITYSVNTGSYTKIGRQVTVTGYCVLTAKGSSTGNARITGLPFTIAGATGDYSAPTLYLENISFLNVFQGFGVNGTTSIALYESTIAGGVSVLDDTNFSNNSAFIINFSYFV